MSAPSTQSTVYLVDDDSSSLLATSRLLRAAGFRVQAFDSPVEFLKGFAPEQPGCLVLDLQMPHMTGLELQDQLDRDGVHIPIVFLTGQGDIPTGVDAIRRGAVHFLTKTAPRAHLLEAVREAIAADAAQREEKARLAALSAPFDKLSPREREVLAHVLRGQLNKQIAADLGIDERSVKRHRTSFMAKLQVQSVPELVRLAHSVGFAHDPQKQP